MAGWENISLDDPQDDYLRLRPIVLRIMKTIYRNFDPAHEPVDIDHWWHSPSLSYQVEPGASEPSIVILNLREGQPDNPVMDTHFTINLNTQRIHDKFQDMRSAAPADCLGDLQTIRNCVCQEVISIKAAQDKRARDLRLQEEAKRQALLQVSWF
jgi:hypothetical protein